MATPADLHAQCDPRSGRPYWSGDGRRLVDEPWPGNDCSGLMHVIMSAAGVQPGGTVSSSQARWCYDNGGELSVNDALNTPGCLVFMGPNRGLAGFGNDGHVGLVVDTNVVYETPCAAGHFSGYSWNQQWRGWTGGGLIPGVDYPGRPVSTPGTVESGTYLRVGMTGGQVPELQGRLNRVGYGLEIDGEFGPATDAAVRDFQATHGLEVDGVVGPATWQALADAVPAVDIPPGVELPPEQTPVPVVDVPPWPGRLLTEGVNGPDVRDWQAQMAARGWRIDVDADYGPQSERVCTAFQTEKGLEVDGIVGPVTWDASWTAPIT